MALLLFSIVITIILIALTGIAILNALTFPRLQPSESPIAFTDQTISILIPARNEAEVIGTTVRALLSQQVGMPFELVILDDHSTDGTAQAAYDAAQGDERLRVIHGEPLPDGWLGKTWACQQLGQAATGDWLLFVDADVQWASGALAALFTETHRTNADMVGVWPTQQTITWGERLVVPLMGMVIVGYLPVLATHHIRLSAFAAANGQALLFHRQVYQRIGAHAAVQDDIVEDVMLARRVVEAGGRLRIVDGNGLIGCRMYDSWQAVRTGFGKNIMAGYGENLLALLLATLFHWAVFLGPWLLLLFPAAPGYPFWPAALIVLTVAFRALTAAVTRQRLLDSIWMPVSVLLMTVIAGQSIWWYLRYGGPHWKGRTLVRWQLPWLNSG